MQLSQLCEPLSAELFGQDIELSDIQIDSRQLKPGDLFVAIRGEQFDGHDFIKQAEEKGAAALIVHKPVKTDLPYLLVKDTQTALGQIAAWHRNTFDIPVIALTGSCGKTTVKEMIASILRQKGEVLATEGNFNNEIGLPLTLLKLNDNHQFAVLEMGANHSGEIARLAKIAKPQVALITNIAPAHLEGFGSIEGVANAKQEIYESLPESGTTIINVDDPHCQPRSIIGNKLNVGWVKERSDGPNKIYDFTASNVQAGTDGHYRFTLNSPEGSTEIQLPTPGKHNIINALLAAAAACSVGASLDDIQNGLSKLQPVKHRMNLFKGRNDAKIIDDTYNANPKSVQAALEFLSESPLDQIFVFGDMGELGNDTEKLHANVGEFAKQSGIPTLFTVGQLSQHTTQAFGDGAQHFKNKDELINALENKLNANSIVLVKGSRAAKMEDIVEHIKR